jgi:hypothetical protein
MLDHSKPTVELLHLPVATQSTHLILQEVSTPALHRQLVERLALVTIIFIIHSHHQAHSLQPGRLLQMFLLSQVEVVADTPTVVVEEQVVF